jgi:hypothetical protein
VRISDSATVASTYDLQVFNKSNYEAKPRLESLDRMTTVAVHIRYEPGNTIFLLVKKGTVIDLLERFAKYDLFHIRTC